MAYTEFYVTKGASAANTNGGGPNLGTNDGPVYTCADCTAADNGADSNITDNTGSDWVTEGVQVDDWLCYDTAGTKEFTRVKAVSVGGDDTVITTSPQVTASANKAANVGGAWATVAHAAVTLSPSFVNAAGNGVRCNIGSGTYTLAAHLTFNNGANETPLVWQGFASAAGDLDTGRTGTAALTDRASFPVIDGTATPYVSTLGNFGVYENIKFTAAGTTWTVYAGTNCTIRRCWLQATNAGSVANAKPLNGSNAYISCIDCDVEAASTSSTLYILDLAGSRGMAVGCRVTHTGTPNAAAVGICLGNAPGEAIGNVVFNSGRGIQTSVATQVHHNTIYNVTTGVYISRADYSSLVAHNVIYTCAGYMIGGDNGAASYIVGNAGGDLTSGRIDTGGLGIQIIERDAVVLSADPFTNKAGEDFTLNDAATGGALCRAASTTWSGQRDLGAVQHTDAGGGGGAPGNLSGGLQ